MTPFAALLRKELRSYFGGPLWYLVAAAFLAYTGFYLHSDLVYFLTFGFGMNIMENFWQLVFFDMRLVLILSIPLLGIIPESMDVLRASNIGSPVTLADGRSAPAIAYFDAARRLSGEALPITIPGEKRSFFGKIFGRKAA